MVERMASSALYPLTSRHPTLLDLQPQIQTISNLLHPLLFLGRALYRCTRRGRLAIIPP